MQLDTLADVSKIMTEVKSDHLEMSQLKSDFDCDKFTAATKGPFIAHQFHFIMRQYTLTLGELNRMLVEREYIHRKVFLLASVDEPCNHVSCNEKIDKEEGNGELISWVDETTNQILYKDLELRKLQGQLFTLESSIVNKQSMIRNFDKIRKILIEKNGGPITNEQYQKEEPEYWAWYLMRLAKLEIESSRSGISTGVLKNVDHLAMDSNIDPSHQINLPTHKNIRKLNEEETKTLFELNKLENSETFSPTS